MYHLIGFRFYTFMISLTSGVRKSREERKGEEIKGKKTTRIEMITKKKR